jgi:mono/diheme cytochrome c family protein
MRTKITALGLLLALLSVGKASGPARAADTEAATLESGLRQTVLPFLESRCLSCHGPKKQKGDLDLSAYRSVEAVARDFDRWDLVLERLEAGTMPPAKAKQPSAEARRQVVAWIRGVRRQEAKRDPGDPGHVPARRLSNAEYDHTIRDLTGVDMRPTKEFPVDPANEAGFDNSADSLAMSPALVRKYLEAARLVADHLVLKPDGIAFAPHPAVADTDRDKYCVRRIIDFYGRQRTDHADYFLAAWRFRHREALGRPGAKLADVAAEAGISPRYLATVWATLEEKPEEVGPIAALQAMWKQLPGPGERKEAVRAECERMRDFVVKLREKLVPEVKNLHAPGVSGGSQPLVLWKNQQMAANRRRYAGGADKLRLDGLTSVPSAAKALAAPTDPEARKRYEEGFARFCSTFPDAFFVKARGRVYLDPKEEKKLGAVRLLSAGFHSMTGYFRDDAPLSELLLDEGGREELDRLWRDFDFITGAPMRQYSSLLWFERAETHTMKGREYDFARAEDRDAQSEAKIRRLAEIYLTHARRDKASAVAVQALEDYFASMSASIRRVEQGRLAAEPVHVKALVDLAERAYRQPLSKAERDGIADFYRSLRTRDGLGHEDALRDTLVRVLMSPHFCYRVEDLPAEGTGVRPLSEYALASRLSYFLWASMPDEELMARAAAGELHKPEVLAAQARRMLRDDRVRGLATEFAGNWLDFRRFEEHNSVDRQRFPAFDDGLRRAMFEEPVRFFIDLVGRNRPVLELLDADHTFVNPALARHYGMPEPAGGPERWVRIDGARRYGRGGLPPMAVFLTRNSPGLRTSPVKRGHWVVTRLIGEKIPPPPPSVPELPADEAKLGELTLRETLARHRADKACAGCHERIDPFGLAFEGYGPVGERRTVDLGGRPVDTRATFPGGGEGKGIDGLRAYLRERRRGDFVDNLCRKLLVYALGRSLLPSDDATLDAMRTRLAAEEYRFGVMVECIVTSRQFRTKRLDSPVGGRLRR